MNRIKKIMEKCVKLPASIKVNVSKGKSGVLLAELPEFDVFTEAENQIDLFFQVNDLIYTYFDVPKGFRGKIIYSPNVAHEVRPSIINNVNPYLFSKYIVAPTANLCF